MGGGGGVQVEVCVIWFRYGVSKLFNAAPISEALQADPDVIFYIS